MYLRYTTSAKVVWRVNGDSGGLVPPQAGSIPVRYTTFGQKKRSDVLLFLICGGLVPLELYHISNQ